MTHTCHAPHCDKPVPPKILACRSHWFMLPKPLRDAIWAAYLPGQEIRKSPSEAWLNAFAACEAFWLEREKVAR